ncbi:toll/interleukin-1 receptor domain-containing protein [Nonomuraea sp. NPDC051191]|uniref:toll/interleukin-1 receptor domain-containing protein n=1 Tax=Nonomuraea sp. NPDC051191 TaxID=3364372 RepID=UPI0037A18088
MDVASLIFTATGTLAGIFAAYFGWVAVRRKPPFRPQQGIPPSSPIGKRSEEFMPSRYDVFVSYSHNDATWVAELCRDLEAQGITVARDEVVLRIGDVLVHTIELAIRQSMHGILVFSPSSVASGWVKQEYATLMHQSIETGRRFIPVVIGDVELPGFAQTRYYADFRNAPPDKHALLVTKMAEALRT